MPVRKSKSLPGWRNITGWIPSLTMKHGIPYESYLEMLFIYVIDFLLCVDAFEAQPLTTSYKYKNRKRPYTPDLEIDLGKNFVKALVEVKPFKKVDWDKFRVIKQHLLTEEKKAFYLVTEKELLSGNMVDILTDLAYHADYPLLPVVEEGYLDVLSNGPISLIDLGAALIPTVPEKAIISIIQLMAHRKISFDFSFTADPISPKTILRAPNDELDRKADLDVLTRLLTRNKI